ncbi:unnamed protein product [Oncorhynchus mykiss]|uniref:Transcription factor Elf N-terminal domain-containing protein n=1 Tax=Oncorhynchus mykiss TaxID=8022 RepID=A0A060ZBR1_ONCMY|nr:unnamed protein product [Oncorhynchus mykiss]
MSAMLQQTELIFEYASDRVNNGLQLDEHLASPAVIVEQVPHSHLLSYSGLACEQTHTDDHLLTTGNNTCTHLPCSHEGKGKGWD